MKMSFKTFLILKYEYKNFEFPYYIKEMPIHRNGFSVSMGYDEEKDAYFAYFINFHNFLTSFFFNISNP